MPIMAGHGLLIKAFFADGKECSGPRTFLAIECASDRIKALNVSSTKGKEHKLAMKSNELIQFNYPPFDQPSFIKLDALYEFENFNELELLVLCNSRTIVPMQLNRIITQFDTYRSEGNHIDIVSVSREQLIARNGKLSQVREA